MTTTVRMERHSIAPHGKQLMTFVAKYPRIIHAELWGREQSGMQTGEAIPEKMQTMANQLWLDGLNALKPYADKIAAIGETYVRDAAAKGKDHLIERGDEKIRVHKSLPNRMLEWASYITVIITTTEIENFFRQRRHPDAEIHFQQLAGMMREAKENSTPTPLEMGQWHLPFVDMNIDRPAADAWLEANDFSHMGAMDVLRMVSSARCARVSHLTHDGKRDIAKDIELSERLSIGSGFGHWSPREHIATPAADPLQVSGNFIGWLQYRKMFDNENAPG